MLGASSTFTIPARYLCSITGAIMREPVITADGHTYEREAIEEWLKAHNSSPKTGQKLKHKELTPNWDKISDINEYLEEHPNLKWGSDIYLPRAWISGLISDLKFKQEEAVKQWFSKDVRLLIEPLEKDYTVFHLAAEFGSPEILELILAQLEVYQKLDMLENLPKPKELNPLHLNTLLEDALEREDWLKAAQWLKGGAELEQPDPESGNSLLARFVCRGQFSVIQWLLTQGASLLSCNHSGNSLLHLSVMYPQPEIAAFLLEMKADPRLKNNEGYSSLHLAILGQSKSMIRLFVSEEEAALSPCHIALIQEDQPLTLLTTLLAEGNHLASINITDAQGRTPLLIAVERRDVVIVRWLLNHVDVSLEKGCGIEQQKALHIAATQDHLEMVDCNCSPPIKNIFKKIVKTLDKFFGCHFYFSSIGFKDSLGTI